MCCNSCRDISPPSEIPSSTSTAWASIGGTVSGRPAMAAMPTANMAPEIRPPGRLAHRNSTPPAVPRTRVSSTWRILARLGMATAIDAGSWLTPSYGKYPHQRQMRQRDAAMHAAAPWRHRARAAGLGRYIFGWAAESFAVFLQSDMNFLRALPCRLLPSASLEHSSEAAVRGFAAFFSAGAIFAAGVAVGAGVAVCARAGLIRSSDANAAATAREDRIIMGAPRVEEGGSVAPRC